MSRFRTPTGELSARIHGAEKEMRERAQGARDASKWSWVSAEFAASLRGKARGYDEAADLLLALDAGHRIPKRRRWTGWSPDQVALLDAERFKSPTTTPLGGDS